MSIEITKVSVIAPCKNEVNHIDNFFYQIFQQKLDYIDLEVIIVDGMSNDGTREIINSYIKKNNNLKVIDNPRKIVSTGLNLAISQSTGQYIIRMDIHTDYHFNYIYNCVQLLLTNKYDCVGGSWIPISKGIIGKGIEIAFKSYILSGGAKSRDSNFSGSVDTVYLGSWPRQVLVNLGGFDEDLVRNQDDELSLRIINSGGIIFQSRLVKSFYKTRTNFRNLFKQFFQYGYWKFPILLKHKSQAKARHFLAPSIAFIYIVFSFVSIFSNLFPNLLLIFPIIIYFIILNIIIFFENSDSINLFMLLISSFSMLIMHASYGLGYLYCLLRYLVKKDFKNNYMSSLSR